MTDDWRAINLANWESRVPIHTGPDGYDLASFDDLDYLSPIVRYDLPRLGRLDGLDVVHLQCHVGTDTVSLARLGARSVRGLDFSPSALAAGRALAERFNHGLGELFTALTNAGLVVTELVEHREVPWNPLENAMIPSTEFEGEFVLAHGRDRMPLTYTVQATKSPLL